jgi:hypothetical protein
MITYIVIFGLLAAVVVLAGLLLTRRKQTVQALPTRGKFITAREVPQRLTEYFQEEHGGASRMTDDKIDVCFRFAAIHQRYDNADYPIDATFTLHRDAYLGDAKVKAEFTALLTKLEQIGLDFVALYGRSASATTQPFRAFIENGGCEHGEWVKPIEESVKTHQARNADGKFGGREVVAVS